MGLALAAAASSHWLRAIAFSPDGTRIATGSHDGSTRIWDTATAAHLATLVAFPDGGYATILLNSTCKLKGDPGDTLWRAIKMCRFEAGELDSYDKSIRQLPAGAPIPGHDK